MALNRVTKAEGDGGLWYPLQVSGAEGLLFGIQWNRDFSRRTCVVRDLSKLAKIWELPVTEYGSFVMSPNGLRVAVKMSNETVGIFDRSWGERPRKVFVETSGLHDADDAVFASQHFSWFPNSSRVVICGRSSEVSVWDCEAEGSGGPVMRVDVRDEQYVTAVAVSAAGRWIIAAAANRVAVVDVNAGDVTSRTTLNVEDPFYVVTAEGVGRVYSTATGATGVLREGTLHVDQRVTCMASSADERTVAVGMSNGIVVVLELPSLRERCRVQADGDDVRRQVPIRAVAVDRDGSKLVYSCDVAPAVEVTLLTLSQRRLLDWGLGEGSRNPQARAVALGYSLRGEALVGGPGREVREFPP